MILSFFKNFFNKEKPVTKERAFINLNDGSYTDFASQINKAFEDKRSRILISLISELMTLIAMGDLPLRAVDDDFELDDDKEIASLHLAKHLIISLIEDTSDFRKYIDGLNSYETRVLKHFLSVNHKELRELPKICDKGKQALILLESLSKFYTDVITDYFDKKNIEFTPSKVEFLVKTDGQFDVNHYLVKVDEHVFYYANQSNASNIYLSGLYYLGDTEQLEVVCNEKNRVMEVNRDNLGSVDLSVLLNSMLFGEIIERYNDFLNHANI